MFALDTQLFCDVEKEFWSWKLKTDFFLCREKAIPKINQSEAHIAEIREKMSIKNVLE
jgi:hypothetical protein